MGPRLRVGLIVVRAQTEAAMGQWRSIVMFSRSLLYPRTADECLQAGARPECATRRQSTTRSEPGSPPVVDPTKSRRIVIGYFGRRFVISVLSAPTTTNIAVSNDRARCPALFARQALPRATGQAPGPEAV
jgi:hypothetical protein